MKFTNSSPNLIITLGLTAVCGLSAAGLIIYYLRKKDENEYFDPFERTSKYRVLEITVPKNIVNTLIGRQGKNIKLIQQQSYTRINFKDGKNDNEMICVIRGSIEASALAENLITDFILNQPVLECYDIWIPQNLIGRIIGRAGDQIREICCRSGAKVTVDNDSSCVNNTKRLIVKGTSEQISIAESLIDEIVKQYQQTQSEIETNLAKREPRLKINSTATNKVEPIIINGLNVGGPFGVSDSATNQFEVYVSAILSPSRFWLQIVGPKATELDLLVDEMTDYYNKQENRDLHLLNQFNKGDLVAAIFQYDNKWYRAEILNISNNESQVELYYVDYGDTDLIDVDKVYELRTDFLRLHFQAIECFLAKIEPTGNDWSEEAVDLFEKLSHVAQWKKLSAKINGYSVREKTRAKREGSPVPGIDLFDVNNEQDIDIAKELVNHGFAVYKKNVPDFKNNSSRATSVSNLSTASSS